MLTVLTTFTALPFKVSRLACERAAMLYRGAYPIFSWLMI